MLRHLPAPIAALCIAGCSSSRTSEPVTPGASPMGQYALSFFNGAALPRAATPLDTVLSGSLDLRSDSTFVEIRTHHDAAYNNLAGVRSDTSTGRWTVSGGQVKTQGYVAFPLSHYVVGRTYNVAAGATLTSVIDPLSDFPDQLVYRKR